MRSERSLRFSDGLTYLAIKSLGTAPSSQAAFFLQRSGRGQRALGWSGHFLRQSLHSQWAFVRAPGPSRESGEREEHSAI